ncbi:hypothetical protein [Dyadobacter sp. CY356]|uniref:hypothetical protein n=1 Tax=Dyadobacter sp. CY356 TaxID=2906442 RepID=UPI001F2C4A54|nr:hypothetical protein [Dyadobacter sp. CY356]MCF0058005.1 hypothetical protein [Dyadobacter sp. CY356]
METGFNIVEVPGSQSRKVAGEKQQWYRTAILKMFNRFVNLLFFRAFRKNIILNYGILDSKLISDILIQQGIRNNLFFPTDSKSMSVFSLKLQKTIRFFFIGDTGLLVKSYFPTLFKMWETDLSYLAVFSNRRAINLKNR